MSYYKHIDFSRVDDSDLIQFIENRQHVFTRTMLDLIVLNLRSALNQKGNQQDVLPQVVVLLEKLQKEVEWLFQIQESKLFPFLRKLLEVYRRKQPLRFLKINLTESSLKQVREEHANILSLLRNMRTLTNQFCPPANADEITKLCYAELSEFCDDLTQQLYREDRFLLPRIAAMEAFVMRNSSREDAVAYGHGGDA